MAKTLEQILGYVPLCGVVQAVKTGIPDVLPSEFFTTRKDVMGDSGRYTRVTGTRQTAKRVEYGAPAIKRELSAIGSYDVKLAHAFQHIDLDVKTYQSLRSYDSPEVQNLGQQEVDRQAAEFRALFDNLEKAAVYSMLSNGAIYFDSNGNLLPSSSGASLTIDYGVSANHQNQLNGIIGASWATATTDIPSDVRAIQKQSVLDTGYTIENAFYGINIPSYFAGNTSYVQPFLSRSPQMREMFLDTGEIPSGLFGVKNWIPVHTAFFNDNDGTNQSFFGDDKIVFTPAVNSTWYELLYGTYPVPKTFGPVGSLQGAMNSFELVRGMFGYATPIDNPMTARLYFGHTFLPVMKMDCIFIADVTP